MPSDDFIKNKWGQDNFALYKKAVSRIEELKLSRNNIFGENLDVMWQSADKAYIPHRMYKKGKRVLASIDDEKGWRSEMIVLNKTDDWRSDVVYPNPFIKLNTALSILIDRNPEAVFVPGSSRYEYNTFLIKNLYQKNWELAKSKQQLKLFIFNLFKYGWAIGRTFPKYDKRSVRVLKEYNPEDQSKSVYEKKEAVIYNDVFRENLDPRNAWIDDMAKPHRPDTLNDWAFRKVYSIEALKREFPKAAIIQGGNVEDVINVGQKITRQKKGLAEVFFYENLEDDSFVVIEAGNPIHIGPLVTSDVEGRKRLSCWQTYLFLRHAETPIGIGFWEASRFEAGLLDVIRNMTVDQLVLSIGKFFLYRGTEALKEGGQIRVEPGIGKKVLDPKGITWVETPGPGVEAWKGIEVFKDSVDEVTGITKTLSGEVTGKTAFEVAQAKESALKRLRVPLDNIADALEDEAYITIDLIESLYSIPEVIKIAEPDLVESYLKEIQGDAELYERNEEGEFSAKVFREVQMGLDTDKAGNFIENDKNKFFRLKPKTLKWEGIIDVKPQSVLVVSKELEKAMDLEFTNLLVPLMHDDPRIVKKVAIEICKRYEKDPQKWLPDFWFQEEEGQEKEEQPLIVPMEGEQSAKGGEFPLPSPPPMERAVSTTTMSRNPRNMAQRAMGQIRKAVPFLGGR